MNWTIIKWAIIAALVLVSSLVITYVQYNGHWSMVYEAVQTPEVPGGQKRFVLFNEDALTRRECTALFDEHLRRLNNNASIIEYEIGCEYLRTKGHGTEFQYQDQWLIP
jgi:hypothetical protein